MDATASFYEEQIYGGIVSEPTSLSQKTDAISTMLLDPIVRNKFTGSEFRVTRIEQCSNGHYSNKTNLFITPATKFPIPSINGNGDMRKSDTQANVYGEKTKLTKNATSVNSTEEDVSTGKSVSHALRSGQATKGGFEPVREITSPQQHSHRILEEEDHQGQYRTTLFVVPQSPQGRSPVTWDDSGWTERPDYSLKNMQRWNEIPGRKRQNVSMTPDICVSEYLQQSNKLISPCSVEEYTKPGQQVNSSSSHPDRTKITFQGPGRYLEEKPYYQVLPSPRRMEIDPVVNGLRNQVDHIRIAPMQTPSPLLLRRNDFNQVVVDIKPRELHEADKRQHVSQWIEVGTLGDTLSSKLEGSDSNPEDLESNLVFSPVDYEDLADGDYQAQINRVTITRDSIDDYQIDSPCMMPQMEWPENRYSADQFYTRRSVFDTIPEESSTPDTTQTTSVKSSLHMSVGAGLKHEKNKVCEGVLINPPPAHQAALHHLTDDNTPNQSNFSSKETMPTPTVTENQLRMQVTKLHEPEYDPKSETDRNVHSKVPPLTAPKPSSHDRYVAPQDIQTASSPHGLNKPNHGTFPRSASNSIKYSHDPLNLETYNTIHDHESDTGLQGVRDLAAYFTDLIQQQSVTYAPSDRFFASSHSFEQEERHRRLRAVEELRKRSSVSAAPDYSKLGYKSSQVSRENSLEDYYPYVRPSSAPRLKGRNNSMNRKTGNLTNKVR